MLNHKPNERTAVGLLRRLAPLVTAGLCVLVVLDAQLRNPLPDMAVGWFTLLVRLDVIFSMLTAIVLTWLLVDVMCHAGDVPLVIVRWVKLLTALFFVQLILATVAWVTNYGVPGWFRDYVYATGYTVVADGPLQVSAIAAHTAIGALSLAASVGLTVWLFRLPRWQ